MMPQKGSPEPLSTVAAPTCQHTQALVTVREPAAETASRARPPRLACPHTEIGAIDDLGTSELGSKNVLVSHQNTRHARSRTHRSCFDMMAPDLCLDPKSRFLSSRRHTTCSRSPSFG